MRPWHRLPPRAHTKSRKACAALTTSSRCVPGCIDSARGRSSARAASRIGGCADHCCSRGRPVKTSHPRVPAFAHELLGAALCLLSACEGDQGPAGPPGPPGTPGTNNRLEQGDDIPGLVVTIQSLTGGTAAGGHFRVGDTLHV